MRNSCVSALRPDLALTICLDSRSTAAMWMRFPIAAAGQKQPLTTRTR